MKKKRTWLTLTLLPLLSMPLPADDKAKKADQVEKAVRDTLAKSAKGDPGWKVRMEALVRLVKAGPAAVPVLEEALKKESPPARALATQALAVIRGPVAIRKAVTDYDLSKLDSARLGYVA